MENTNHWVPRSVKIPFYQPPPNKAPFAQLKNIRVDISDERM